jgi:hypothetical protein
MPWPTVYIDVLAAVKNWVDHLPGLTGPGSPLPLGAHIGDQLRSPYRGSYVLLTRIGGGPDPLADANVDQARISGAVYGTNRRFAGLAANAYANALVAQAGYPSPVPGGRLLTVTDVTGPTYIPDGDEERFLVDAVFHIQPS